MMDMYTVLKDKNLFSDREARVASMIHFLKMKTVTKSDIEKLGAEMEITPKTVENAVKKLSTFGLVEYDKKFVFEKKEDDVAKVIEYMNEKMGTKFSVTASGTRKPINDRLNETDSEGNLLYTVDDLINTFDKLYEWTEGIPELLKNLRPQTTFNGEFYKRYNAYKQNRDYYYYPKLKIREKQALQNGGFTQQKQTNNVKTTSGLQSIPKNDDYYLFLAKQQLGWQDKTSFTREESQILMKKMEEIRKSLNF